MFCGFRGAGCLFLLGCLTCALLESHAGVPRWYKRKRQNIIAKEERMRIGATMRLTKDERQVNKILMYEKKREVENSRKNGKIFPPSISFFQAKKLIDESRVFKIIKRMPKGGALHVHSSALTSLHWVIQNATYRDTCYMCYKEGKLSFQFAASAPNDDDCNWTLVNTARQEHGNSQEFDELLFKNLSIIVDEPEKVYYTIDDVWARFQGYFGMVGGLVSHTPVRAAHFYEGLREFHEDNVQYLEMRSGLSGPYDLDGSEHDRLYALQSYKEISDRFKEDYPDFYGMKIIHTTSRYKTPEKLLPYIQDAISFKKKFPDFYIGFDVVGQEDHGATLYSLAEDFFYPEQQTPPVDLPYFFHAGETDWDETQVDENLIDAVLLNTTRIGHGYALHKHPEVMKLVKERGIGIEVNPISNQVLKLVGDLRDHPAAALVARNYPIVISSDDPAVWDATPLSHDFYEAFMALAGEDADLTLLKQLAINSYKYSGLSDTEKGVALSHWTSKWNEFIEDILRTEKPNYDHLF